MSSIPDSRPFTLAVGVDLTDQKSSGYAFDQALRIASRLPSSEMHVVYVLPEEASPDEIREASGLLRLYVAEKAAVLGLRGPSQAGIHVRWGVAATEIARVAADVRTDMIVVGTRKGTTLLAMRGGSTAERVISLTECPVFVAGPRPSPAPGAAVVTIEPPCPDCVQQRFASRGKLWWCARHAEPHHLRRHHVYSYVADFPFATHDSETVPTGSD